jgi:hypothetical protein
MQAQREARRARAADSKARRESDVREAEKAGMRVEAVDFLNLLSAHRREHGGSEPAPWSAKGQAARADVWGAGGAATSRIRVCVRKRPMLKPERLARDFDVVDVTAGGTCVTVHEPKTRVDLSKALDAQSFSFDAVFGERDGNDAVFGAAVSPLIEHALGGGTATVFAFGQTGSGKSTPRQPTRRNPPSAHQPMRSAHERESAPCLCAPTQDAVLEAPR